MIFEKDYLKEAGLPEITHSDAALVEELIGNPDSAQQLLNRLKSVQGGTADGFHRNAAWRFGNEMRFEELSAKLSLSDANEHLKAFASPEPTLRQRWKKSIPPSKTGCPTMW